MLTLLVLTVSLSALPAQTSPTHLLEQQLVSPVVTAGSGGDVASPGIGWRVVDTLSLGILGTVGGGAIGMAATGNVVGLAIGLLSGITVGVGGGLALGWLADYGNTIAINTSLGLLIVDGLVVVISLFSQGSFRLI